jgi:hypothetical protein
MSGKMKCRISSEPTMMAHVEATLLTKGHLTKSYNLAIIGRAFLKMKRNTWPAAMIAKEWENLH